ncbi:MAG: glycerophosphodiester phosphodiesterase [Clostridia bacterium]|nr:glycerophosphodiester phosphodiesterase [Clostridia bacterium]
MKRKTDFLIKNLIAHRGYHDDEKGIPENSMKAFAEAIKNNYIIELDVHLLKDSEVAVFHDDNLKRMTDINKKIKDCTYSEISKLNLKQTEEKIPLLKEVLKLVDGKVSIIIELKTDLRCRKLEKEVIKILKQYNGEYAVKSFNPLAVNYFRKHSPSTIRGQLASDFKNDKMFILKKIFLKHMLFNFISKPDFISYDIRALPSKKIQKLREKQLILGWTVRSSEDMEKAKKYCDNMIFEKIKNNRKGGNYEQ